MLSCQIIISEDEILALAPEWIHLQKDIGNTPFTNYEWFDAWWQHIAKPLGKTLHIATAKLNGKLVGILPLVIQRKMGLRILQGVGLEAFFLSDMLAPSPECAKHLWNVVRRSRLYDFAMVRDVSTESICGQILAEFATPRDREKAPCLLSQWKSGDEWITTLPKKVVHENRRITRRLQEKGDFAIKIHTTGKVPPGIVEGMVQQKIDWCIKNKKKGLFNQPGVMLFFNQLVNDALANNILYLAWVECSGAVIGYTLGFRHKKTFFDYFVTYDSAWMTFSPGNIVLTRTISWVIDNGFSEFNFLQGEGQYKARLTNSTHDYVEWTFASTLIGRLKENLYIGFRTLKRRIKGR